MSGAGGKMNGTDEKIREQITALSDPVIEKRHEAVSALKEIGEPAVDTLIDGMASDDRELRGFLSQALCRIGEPAVASLTSRLNDPDETLQQCVTLTLWQMGETGIPEMVKKVKDGE
jgi:HEAT repeat protein